MKDKSTKSYTPTYIPILFKKLLQIGIVISIEINGSVNFKKIGSSLIFLNAMCLACVVHKNCHPDIISSY